MQIPGQFDEFGNPRKCRPMEVRALNDNFKLSLHTRMLHNRHSNHVPGVVLIPKSFNGALGPDSTEPGVLSNDEVFGCASPREFDIEKFVTGGYRAWWGGSSHVFSTKQDIVAKPRYASIEQYAMESAFTYVGDMPKDDWLFVSTLSFAPCSVLAVL